MSKILQKQHEKIYLHKAIDKRIMFSGKIVRNFIRTDIVKSSYWTFGAGALASLIAVAAGRTHHTLVVGLKSSLVGVFADGTFTVTSLNSRLPSNF